MKQKDKVQNLPSPLQSAIGNQQLTMVRWGYAIGTGLCLLGLIILSVAFGEALRTTTRGFYRIALPGTSALELKEPGIYVGLYQHKGNDPLPIQALAQLEISLSDTETGAYLPLERGAGAQAVSMGGDMGVLLFQFEIASPGKFLLNASYPASLAGPRVEAMLIHESLQHNRADIAVGVLLCLVLSGFGIYILIRARRRARVLRPSESTPLKKK